MTTEPGGVFALLEELLYHTRKIAERQADASIDLTTHTDSCRSLLTSLQETVRERGGLVLNDKNFGDAGENDLLARLLKELDEQTRQSREVLVGLLARTESELSSLRLAKKQVGAYRRQAHLER